MGVYGALFSAVSGLKAQAQSMGIISDNIANANTVGYKGSVNKFQTLVTSPATATAYTPGGVLSRPFANVDQQGLMQASQSRTDVGVTGRGFLPVTSSVSSTGALNSTVINAYTRAGSFTVDKNGNLVNSAGFYLMGVPVSQTTGLPTTTSPNVQTLSLVNVGTLTGIAKGTSTLSIGANLPAVPGNSTALSVSGLVSTTAANSTTLATDAHTYYVYSSNGDRCSLTNVTYTTNATSTALTVGGTITNSVTGETFTGTIGTITLGTSSSTYTAGTGFSFSDGSTYAPDIDATGLKQTGTTTQFGYLGVDPKTVTAVVYDSLGVANNLTLEFSRGDSTVTNPTTALNNQWVASIKSMTLVATGATATTTTLPMFLDGTTNNQAAAGTQATNAAAALLTFNTNGTLNAGPTGTFGGTAGLTLTDGATAFGGSSFTVNYGTSGTPSGMTQYSSNFAVSFLNQNGLAFSYRTGIAFDEQGMVSAVFQNGTVIPLYKIPLVNFSNVNALQAETGNAYTETGDSGTAVANYAGLGGVGEFTPSALENSTVDLATEFSNMIITQRSFSANARTITTADQELQEVVNLVR